MVMDVLPAGAAAIGVSLSRHSLLPNEATSLTLSIVDEAGNVVTNFTGQVDVACNESSGVTIPTGHMFVLGDAGVYTFAGGVSFTSDGQYNVSASVNADPTILGYDFATVNNRTVEMKIYNIFQGTLPDYWLKRSQVYNLADEGFRNSSPVMEIYRVGINSAGQLSTFYTVGVEARNIPQINMSSPTFAHLRNPVHTGKGNVTIAIDYYMMTEAQILAADGIYFPVGKSASWDGWEYLLSYNATMDRAAASQIINLPSASWSDKATLDAWWATNNLTVSRNWERAYYPTVASPGFLGREGGYGTYTGRLDLRACEDGYNYGGGWWGSVYMLKYIDADHVSLFSYNVGYGLDALVARWLYWGGIGSGANYPNGTPNGIVSYEPWYDNMTLRVNISDDHANLTMYGVVVYAFRSWTSESAPLDMATLRMELIRLDYLLQALPGKSELNVYAPNGDDTDPTYTLMDPGSSKYGRETKYDYVPANIQLKPGESMIIESPKTLAIGYRPKPMTGNYSDTGLLLGGYYFSLRMLERFGNATIHPIGAPPGTTAINARTGDLTIVGPFVPIVKYLPTIPWLISQPAPRIELWVGPQEVYAPCAAFLVTPLTGDTTTVFSFNGTYSGDVEDASSSLEVRWDWNGDGTWDTGWSTSKLPTHSFAAPGDYTVLMEVRDSMGLTNITALQVHVDVVIPEFADLGVPIVFMVIVIAFFARRNGQRKEE
jgi:hypothetical protein